MAHYRVYDWTVELDDMTYRPIVVHSRAHDKRRHKRFDRLLKQDLKKLEDECMGLRPVPAIAMRPPRLSVKIGFAILDAAFTNFRSKSK